MECLPPYDPFSDQDLSDLYPSFLQFHRNTGTYSKLETLGGKGEETLL